MIIHNGSFYQFKNGTYGMFLGENDKHGKLKFRKINYSHSYYDKIEGVWKKVEKIKKPYLYYAWLSPSRVEKAKRIPTEKILRLLLDKKPEGEVELLLCYKR